MGRTDRFLVAEKIFVESGDKKNSEKFGFLFSDRISKRQEKGKKTEKNRFFLKKRDFFNKKCSV